MVAEETKELDPVMLQNEHLRAVKGRDCVVVTDRKSLCSIKIKPNLDDGGFFIEFFDRFLTLEVVDGKPVLQVQRKKI